jgi:uncharacterized protein YkwD
MTLPSMAEPHPAPRTEVVDAQPGPFTMGPEPLRRRLRAGFRLLLVLGLVVGLASACIPLETDEQYLYDRTNELRMQNGVRTLLLSDKLTARARLLAQDLAARGVLQHSDLHQIDIAWTTAGENIGRGNGIKYITDLFVASPSHRANMLNPSFLYQSVGIARANDGTIYVVHLFTG